MTSTAANSELELVALASHSTTAMTSNGSPTSRYELVSRACGLLVALISGAALVGWFASSVILKGIRADYIPMAPNTALVFLLLGAILTAFTVTSKGFLLAARCGAVIAAALAATRLSEYLTDLELRVDHWFFLKEGETDTKKLTV